MYATQHTRGPVCRPSSVLRIRDLNSAYSRECVTVKVEIGDRILTTIVFTPRKIVQVKERGAGNETYRLEAWNLNMIRMFRVCEAREDRS